MISIVDLIDQIDYRRYDSLALLDAANAFGRLGEAEQDQYLGLWDFAGLEEAQHPLTAFLRESHNDTCVVRDLDGALQLLWQEDATSERWFRGPLYRESLIDLEEVEDRLAAEPGWFEAAEIHMDLSDLGRLIADLPSSDTPVLSF